MKSTVSNLIIKTILAYSISFGVLSVSATDETAMALNPVEAKTTSFLDTMSKNGNLKTNIQDAQYIEKDTQYMDSHLRDNTVASVGDDQTDAVLNTVSKQFFRVFFGVYEREIKTQMLTFDLSDDEITEENIAVSSYDKRNFELTMKARKNRERMAKDQSTNPNNEVKAKWKISPRVGHPGVHVGYLAQKFNFEMRLTTTEQVINVHKNLRDIAIDLFYNVDMKNNESSLTVSKPVAKNLNLQVQSIGRAANSFENADERVSFIFGRYF